jgi:hypothetical protein
MLDGKALRGFRHGFRVYSTWTAQEELITLYLLYRIAQRDERKVGSRIASA